VTYLHLKRLHKTEQENGPTLRKRGKSFGLSFLTWVGRKKTFGLQMRGYWNKQNVFRMPDVDFPGF
jgi:hypothetical protein